jgi:hypothetical protein
MDQMVSASVAELSRSAPLREESAWPGGTAGDGRPAGVCGTRGCRTWLCIVACFSPALRRRPGRRSPQPAEAGAEAVGPLQERPAARTRDGYQRGQPAGGQWRSQPHTIFFEGTSQPPGGYREFRPATREQARYRPPDLACFERPRNFRSRREYPPQSARGGGTGPGRRRLVQAPPAVSPHHARESAAACHPAARYHSLKRTSRHAVPSL